MKENAKRTLRFKINEDSDRPNKADVIYHQIVLLLEEEIPRQLQLRDKLESLLQIFIEEQMRECRAKLEIVSLDIYANNILTLTAE